MKSVYLYKSEVLTPNGVFMEENIRNFLLNKCMITPLMVDHTTHDSTLFKCGSIDWQNEVFSNFKTQTQNKKAVAVLIDKVLENSKVKNIDQVICMLAPQLSDLDSFVQTGEERNKFLEKIDVESFLIERLAHNGIQLRREDISILDNTCTSGVSIMGYAYQGIKLGKWKSVLVIAVDLIDHFSLQVLKSLGALAVSDMDGVKISRPFDNKRSGFIKSDGAGCAIITEDQGIAAESLGEILSFAQTSDAYKLTDGRDDCEAVIKVMELAMDRAQVGTHDIDVIKAHGTSTVLNDLHEAHAIEKIFGKKPNGPLVTTLKGHLGHVTDASGLVESAIICAALKKGYLLPILNLEETEFELNFIRTIQPAEKNRSYHFLSNAFGFGGNNCSIVIKSLI